MSLKFKVIHGPNLNLLGVREPDIYGNKSLDDINKMIKNRAEEIGVQVEIIQSNHEGVIIDAIHSAADYDGIIINPAGFGHTSVAILDAFKAVKIPSVEIHLSNIYSREDFRRHTITGSAMVGVIAGFGADSYLLGLDALRNYINSKKGATK